MHRVGFVCSSSLHVRMFSNVIKELAKNPGIEPFVISLDPFYIGIHGNVASTIEIEEMNVKVVEINLNRSTQSFRMASFLNTTLQVLQFERSQLDRIIKEWSPAVLVLGNDTGHLERAIIRVAGRQEILRILIQDGFIFDENYSVFSMLKHKVKKYSLHFGLDKIGMVPYGMGGCDIIFAFGEHWKNIFDARLRRPSQKVKVVGNPLFDDFCSVVSKKEVNTRIEGQRVISYFCTNFLSGLGDQDAHGSQTDEIIALKKCLTRRYGKEVHLIAKLHPADSIKDYGRLKQEEDNCFSLVDNCDLKELILKSWMCITNFSSAYLYAIAAGKVCILSKVGLNNNKRYEQLINALNGISVSTIDDIDRELELLDQPSTYRMIVQRLTKESEGFVDLSHAGNVVSNISDEIINNIPKNSEISKSV